MTPDGPDRPTGDRDPVAESQLADGLQRLWAPHRLSYIRGENKPPDASAGRHCPFCRVPSLGDEEGLIVARGERVYAVMNLYPYNTGHLLICPYRHFADLTDAADDEYAEIGRFTRRLMTAMRHAMAPHGFNVGINQGPVAGAGIAAHLHQHIVPRWGGDANFMPVVGRTKILPQELAQTREVLAAAWAELDETEGQ